MHTKPNSNLTQRGAALAEYGLMVLFVSVVAFAFIEKIGVEIQRGPMVTAGCIAGTHTLLAGGGSWEGTSWVEEGPSQWYSEGNSLCNPFRPMPVLVDDPTGEPTEPPQDPGSPEFPGEPREEAES